MKKTSLALLALASLALSACSGTNAATDGRVTTGAAPVGPPAAPVGFGDSTLAGGNVGTGAMGRGGASGGAAAAVDRPLAPGGFLNPGRPAWR